jgi:acetylornithine/succinyldiaminopimelate/putrescine aminotransferase
MMSLLESFRTYLAQTSVAPIGLEIVGGEGVWLFDAAGRKYLDAISGIGVNNLGHNHPAVIKAVEGQLWKMLHGTVYGEFVIETQVKLAEKLAALLPHNLSVTYPTNSGSEAVEGAIKLARRHTGRTGIVSFESAYHGSTMGALSLTSSPELRWGYEPLVADVVHLPFNNLDQLDRITAKTAGVIVEPIQGEAGVIEATPEFLNALRLRCTEVGALLVFDEVQTGMGRTGKLFAFEHYDVVPDVLILGKALGGGLPLAAFIASQEIMSCLTDPPLGHMTTFGGNPVACAAASVVLDEMTKPGFMDHVVSVGNQIKSQLAPGPGTEVRGRGLMLAVQLPSEGELQRVVGRCLENGVITDWFLYNSSALRVYPPLVITEGEADVLRMGLLRTMG